MQKLVSDIPPNSMTFTCPPNFLKCLIYESSLNKTFPFIILNFEEDRVWWENKAEGFFFTNYGFFTYNFVSIYYETGAPDLKKGFKTGFRAGFKIEDLINAFKSVKKYSEIIFWVNNETQTYGTYAGNLCKTKFPTIPVEEIMTAVSKPLKLRLDKDSIPILPQVKDEEQFLYGGKLKASWLKKFIEMAEYFNNPISFHWSSVKTTIPP